MKLDPAIVEAVARKISEAAARAMEQCTSAHDAARAVLAAVTPLIRVAALEEAARAFDPDADGHDSHSLRFTATEVAAALRALKERP